MVIRSRKSKKDRQYNELTKKNKRTNNNLQLITEKNTPTKDNKYIANKKKFNHFDDISFRERFFFAQNKINAWTTF
jgi:hypothetical protein